MERVYVPFVENFDIILLCWYRKLQRPFNVIYTLYNVSEYADMITVWILKMLQVSSTWLSCCS